TKNAQAEKA
nr:initiation factor IF2 beta' [Escherichia coli, Peptide Partial, 9 aa] [Escherichia coli]